MKKIMMYISFAMTLLILGACSNAGAEKITTARDIFQKAEQAFPDLQTVRSHIVLENTSAPVNPDEKKTIRVDMKEDSALDPLVIKQHNHIKESGAEAWEMEMYTIGEQLYGKKEGETEWGELANQYPATFFGPLFDETSPVLKLSLFEPFIDSFELEPIDYGYSLQLKMTKEEFEKLNEKLDGQLVNVASYNDDAFILVEKADIEIQIDRKTWYVTDFKMTTDVTTYVGRDMYRDRHKADANYSYFNDVGPVAVPADIKARVQ